MIFLNSCDRVTYNLMVTEREGPWTAYSESRPVTNHDEAGLVPKWHQTVSSSEQESMAHASDEHRTSIRIAPQWFTQYPKPGCSNDSAVGLCSPRQCSVRCLISLKTGTSMISPLSAAARGRSWGQAPFHPPTTSVPAKLLHLTLCGVSGGPAKGEGGKAAVREEVQETKERRVSPLAVTPC